MEHLQLTGREFAEKKLDWEGQVIQRRKERSERRTGSQWQDI